MAGLESIRSFNTFCDHVQAWRRWTVIAKFFVPLRLVLQWFLWIISRSKNCRIPKLRRCGKCGIVFPPWKVFSHELCLFVQEQFLVFFGSHYIMAKDCIQALKVEQSIDTFIANFLTAWIRASTCWASRRSLIDWMLLACSSRAVAIIWSWGCSSLCSLIVSTKSIPWTAFGSTADCASYNCFLERISEVFCFQSVKRWNGILSFGAGFFDFCLISQLSTVSRGGRSQKLHQGPFYFIVVGTTSNPCCLVCQCPDREVTISLLRQNEAKSKLNVYNVGDFRNFW